MSAVSYVPDQSAAHVHSSLRRSLKAMEQARQCAVLWFAEVMWRRLYLLPEVRQALTSGELGYTKAREIVGVATPETQDEWLQAAKKPRKELVREVRRVKRADQVDPGQAELLPTAPTVVAPKDLPVRFQMDLTPEQEARRAALVERLHKLGGVPNDKAELMLEALAALVETKGKAPRGALAGRPPVQIHVHEKGDRMTVQTDSEERELSRADAARIRCDAAICEHGGRNTTTIPPRVRRQVLARDRHHCQASGCDRTRFLEVHHIVPRNRGGNNQADNLVTLCGSCHRFLHEHEPGTGVEALMKTQTPK